MMLMQIQPVALNSRGLNRALRSVESRPSQVARPKRARCNSWMGTSSSPSPNGDHAQQLRVMQTHLTEAQTLLRPDTSAVFDSVSVSVPALTSAVLNLSHSLQHPVAQASMLVASRTASASAGTRNLRADLLTSLQMVPSMHTANLAAPVRTACSNLQATLQTTSIQLPTVCFSRIAGGSAFGSLQGLSMMVLVGGAYLFMLVSSFLFAGGEPDFALPRGKHRMARKGKMAKFAAQMVRGRGKKFTPRRPYCYTMSTTPYPARRTQTGKANRGKGHSKVSRTRRTVQAVMPVKKPIADLTPYITAAASTSDRWWMQTTKGATQLIGRTIAMHPYMMNLLLQADPPPKLRRYPTMRMGVARRYR